MAWGWLRWQRNFTTTFLARSLLICFVFPPIRTNTTIKGDSTTSKAGQEREVRGYERFERVRNGVDADRCGLWNHRSDSLGPEGDEDNKFVVNKAQKKAEHVGHPHELRRTVQGCECR